jgi:segregation and condensation protein A
LAASGTNTDGKDGTLVPMDSLWQSDAERALSEPSLLIDVQGFEGPLDLLLHLARNQRVDLARISVLALAEQYLEFVERARAVRLELAADYLVMAAWLAYLKSKLLIPKQQGDDGETGEELAASLQFRLKRLEAMRDAAAALVNRNRLGRDVFARGMPEVVMVDRASQFSATLYDLLTAYASQRQRHALSPQERASALASSFAASLELVREGKLEVRQNAPFEPIYMRAKPGLSEFDEDEDV